MYLDYLTKGYQVLFMQFITICEILFSVNIFVRLLFILLFFICSCNNSNKLKPSGDLFKEEDKNWEALYAIELERSLLYGDDIAFHFFWPYYLRERYLNKNKKTPHPKVRGQTTTQTN